MARSAALPALKAESGLSRYLNEIRQFPMLDRSKNTCSPSWKEHDDPEAARRLVTSHLRLVAKIAMGYRGYGLPVSEIVSEGNVGLMQAVKTLRARQGLPPGHLCHVVDPRLDPGIRPALVVAGEDGHHRRAEEAVLQPAQGQEPDLAPSRKAISRPSSVQADRHRAGRDRDGSDRNEPPPVRARLLAQRAAARGTAKANGRTGWRQPAQAERAAGRARKATATSRCSRR